jgi:hypothetical protein
LFNFNVTTWPYIPEDSKLCTHHRENLKSHKFESYLLFMNAPSFSIRSANHKLVVCFESLFRCVIQIKEGLHFTCSVAVKQNFIQFAIMSNQY